MARKFKSVKATIADAISFAHGELQSLAEEVREVVDNASGTPREHTQRIQTLDETASQLEGIDEPSVGDELGKLEVEYHEALPRSRRKGLSRADRRDNATGALDSVIQLLNEQKDDFEEKHPDADASYYDSLIDDLERMKDDAEAVEFPGMYG